MLTSADWRSQWIATRVLVLFAIIWPMPFATVVPSSIRSLEDLISSGVLSIPSDVRWENFAGAWQTGGSITCFRDGLLLIAVKVLLGLLIASTAA